MEEHIEPSGTYQTEFDEWVYNGCKKAEEIFDNTDSKTE